MSNDNNTNNFEIPIIPNEKLKNKFIVQKFVKNTMNNFITLELNHKYPKTTIILETRNIKSWSKFHHTLDKEFDRKGITDNDDRVAIHDSIDDNHERIYNDYDTENDNDDPKEEKEKPKREITTFKYSKLGQGNLYEAVFIEEGLPVFIKYNPETNSFEDFDKLEEATRILVPPSYEECPYLRYEFESLEEINSLNKFIDDNNIDIDYLYKKGLEIVSKYNNQSVHKRRLY